MVVKLIEKEKLGTTQQATNRGGGADQKCSPFFMIFGVMLLFSLFNVYNAVSTKSSILGTSVLDVNTDYYYEAFFAPNFINATRATLTTVTAGVLALSNQPSNNNNSDGGLAAASSSSSLLLSAPSQQRDALIQEALHISRERLIKRVPNWTMEFFDWQQEQLKHVTQENWKSFRFVVLRCTRQDLTCGGMTDRLKPLPIVLRMAHASKRIVMIRWTVPHPLEEFFLPTPHFNWTVPWYMNDLLKLGPSAMELQDPQVKVYEFCTTHPKLREERRIREYLRQWNESSPTILEFNLQAHDGGARLYKALKWNSTPNESYESMFHGIFRGVFQPHPAVERLVRERWNTFDVTPSEYTSAHSRSFYKIQKEKVPRVLIEDLAKFIVNCTTPLMDPGKPIYFASDSTYALEYIQEQSKGWNIAVRTNVLLGNLTKDDPLHMDFAGRGNKTYPAEAFYDAYVDLLVMGNAKCVGRGRGGYGEFASMISFDPFCRAIARTMAGPQWKCEHPPP